jgi:hypothetical protein
MIDVTPGPLFTVVSIAIPVAVACLAVGAALAVGPRVVVLFRQCSYDRATERERRRWLFRLDPASARDPDAARRLVAALHPGGRRGVSAWASGWPDLALAVRWADGRARWEMEAPRQLTRAVESAVFAAFPAAELEKVERGNDAETGGALRLALRGEPPAGERPGAPDLGAILVELLSRLPHGATASWTLHVRPLPPERTSRHTDVPGLGEMLLDSFLNRQSRPAPRQRQDSRPQAVGPTYAVTASLDAGSAPSSALRAWLFDAMSVVGSLRASGWTVEATVGGRPSPMRVTPTDLAELWGLSAGAGESRAVDVVRSRRLPAPTAAGEGLRAIGLDSGGPVLVPEDLFARHALLLGRTGAGKSTELVALAADDIRSGRGLTFLDPHGDAIARLLDAVPPDQAHRVHLLELAARERPRAFNPIELDGAEPELVAAQFVDTIRDLYFSTFASAYRQVQYLRYGLMTLLTMPPRHGPWTLDALYSLFVDPAFRDELTRGLKDPILVAFWKHQWQQTARGGDPSADAILAKLGAFLSYPSIHAIVGGARSTIRPRAIMDAGDVLLVDLSGVGRDNMRLFGSLLISRYCVAALGRQRVAADERTPHTLYVDEVQNFDTSSLRSIPGEGRKFGLRITMATQYLKGLGLELQSAIRANVATMMLLQPSAEDIRLVADLLAPLSDRDLLNLPRFRMAIRTELEGQGRVLTADVLPEPEPLGSASTVRRLSDERDGRTAR